MRFALLGEHPHGIELSLALLASNRHSLVALTGAFSPEILERLGHPRRISDLEELLADPTVDAVIVAGSPSVREAQLRRALQSERHVLCVHPADARPDLAYEAAMIQTDTRKLLFPILPDSLHPALARFASFLDREGTTSPLGAFRLLRCERSSRGPVLDDESIPGWEILRRLGGELAEVSALADEEAFDPLRPILLCGRFEAGGLFQVTLLPEQPDVSWRLTLVGTRAQAELFSPLGAHGPVYLRWNDGREDREEYWPTWDPWPTFLALFEASLQAPSPTLSWQDEVRLLELDDAARRSVQRRRVHLMEYQEASEEVGFKGTMALTGCALIWVVLGLLIASRWLPAAGWLVLPLLISFIGMQLLRYLVPSRDRPPSPS